MRIHTDKLSMADVSRAAYNAGATVETLEPHGSRSRAFAYEVKLTGTSRRRPNGGTYGADRDAYAATWDQWGVFLGLLFDIDSSMTTAYYADQTAFDHHTDGRFSGLDASDITIPLNHDHTFRFQGVPREQQCTKCGAVQRW